MIDEVECEEAPGFGDGDGDEGLLEMLIVS